MSEVKLLTQIKLNWKHWLKRNFNQEIRMKFRIVKCETKKETETNRSTVIVYLEHSMMITTNILEADDQMKQENKENVLLNAFEDNIHDSKPYKSCKYIERTKQRGNLYPSQNRQK